MKSLLTVFMQKPYLGQDADIPKIRETIEDGLLLTDVVLVSDGVTRVLTDGAADADSRELILRIAQNWNYSVLTTAVTTTREWLGDPALGTQEGNPIFKAIAALEKAGGIFSHLTDRAVLVKDDLAPLDEANPDVAAHTLETLFPGEMLEDVLANPADYIYVETEVE